MNLTGFALGNTRFTALVVILLAVTGFALFGNFPSKEDPEVTVREAVVAAYFPGMSPERVENLITRKLEKQIRRIPEVRKIKSSSKTGVSIALAIAGENTAAARANSPGQARLIGRSRRAAAS